jgi:Uma2 family endonuclease
MGEAGIIGPDERVELIRGEIVEMNPVGKEHDVAVRRINQALNQLLNTANYIIDQQNPVRTANHSEPKPDLMVTPHRDDFMPAQGFILQM